MKEIIEYILAGLIIVSIIPAVTYIEQIAYTPKPTNVPPIFQAYLSNIITNTLQKIFASGNITLLQPNILTAIINSKLGQYPGYSYNVTLYSIGIKSISIGTGYINVTTYINGSVSALIVYNNLAIYSTNTPSRTYQNYDGTYTFQFVVPNTYNIAIITCILESGIARYIKYDIINKTMKMMNIANINGELYLLLPSSINTVLTTSPGTMAIFYYSKQNINSYIKLGFNYVSYKSIGVTYSPGLIGDKSIITYNNFTYVTYNVKYSTQITIYGTTYNAFTTSILTNNTILFNTTTLSITYTTIPKTAIETTTYTEQTGTETSYTISSRTIVFSSPLITRFSMTSISYTQNISIIAGNPQVSYDSYSTSPIGLPSSTTTTSNSLNTYSLAFPIYNAVLIIVRDQNGNLYYALPYNDFITFGSTIPKNWPVTTMLLPIRIGMINYELKITVWRQSI